MKSSTITHGIVMIYVLSMILPEIWAEDLHVGEVPLGAFILVAVFFVLLVRAFRTGRLFSAGLTCGFAALVIMSIHGYLRGNIEEHSLKYFVADVYCFSALLAGLALGRFISHESLDRLVLSMAKLATIAIILTYCALFAGLVHPGIPVPAERRVTGSIFEASTLLLILLPWASVSRGQTRKRSWRFLVVMLCTCAVTGWISGTRSIVILTLCGGVFCYLLKRREIDGSLVMRLTTIATVALAVLLSGLEETRTSLFSRLMELQVADETRYVEVATLWRQIADDVVTGQGMGSRFVSNVVIKGNPMASAPHIGVVTFMFKGGVFGFAACVIAPMIMALMVYFSPSRETQRGSAATIVMYIATACLSGGWEPLPMLAYGLAMSATATGWRRKMPAPKPYVGLTRCESYMSSTA